MSFKRYENNSLQRIEKLLERLLLVFEGQKEAREIENALKDITVDKNELKGSDFMEV